MSDEETIRMALIEAAPAREALTRLIAAKEQAEKERDEAHLELDRLSAPRDTEYEEPLKLIGRLQHFRSLTDRLSSMREAMEPFAKSAARSDVPELVLIPDGHALLFRPGPNGPVVAITEGDLRRARAELDAAKKEIGG